MRTTRTKLVSVAFAAVVLGLSLRTGLSADSRTARTTTVRASPATSASRTTGKTSLLEVRFGPQTWQGMDSGRVGNFLLLLGRDGQLRRFDLASGAAVRDLGRPFEPAGVRELEASLKKEFGPKFKTLRTPHYVICHNTNDAFAQETAELVEQLYKSFTLYFGARGMGLERPRFPMVVVVFDDESEFRNYLSNSPGASSLSRVSGIYSVETNRVALFNAFGKESKKYGDARWHNLSTVIHEATHQIAFNSGCHGRLTDTPVWLVEGLAMYFEAPEIQGSKIVWTSVGKLNLPRMERFAKFRQNGREPDSIKSLVMNDARFRDDSAACDAYAECWAMTYFLVNHRMPQFLRYVKAIAAKPALKQDTAETRLQDFQAAFGRDLRSLDRAFVRYIDELQTHK